MRPAAILLAALAFACVAVAAEAPAARPAIDTLLAKLADKDLDVQQRARLAYRAHVFNASRPGAEAERLAAAQAICQRLATPLPQPATLALLDALEHIGRDEAVPTLAKFLAHTTPLVRERARRALTANPSAKASATLRDALAKATAPAWQIGLINALGYRKDKAAVAALIALAGSRDEAVRVNAAEALALLGDKAATAAISSVTQKATDTSAWRRSLVAYLALADALADSGDKAAALPMYRNLLEAEGHLKVGAVVGLGRAGGADELPGLLAALADADPQVRGAARSALGLLPVEAVTAALAEKAKTATPAMKALLLGVLGERRSTSALPAFLAATADADPSVRLAAYAGIGQLGDDRAVPTLLAALPKAAGKERDAVQAALGHIHSPAATQALIAALGKGDGKTRAAIADLLAARRAASAMPALLQAAGDSDASVARAALKALGTLADAKTLPALVAFLVKNPSSTTEKAIAAACKRLDPDAAAAPLVAALPKASPKAKAALLRLLARIESPKALAAVQAARRDADATVQDAAVRALAAWHDPAVLGDLLDIAKTATQETHRVIALRGYVRLVGAVQGKPASEIVTLYQDAMAVARRPDDKRMVLAGIAAVPSLGTLQMAEQYLADPALKSEAVVTVINVAKLLHGAYRAEAKAALTKAIPLTTDNALAGQAKTILARIDKLGHHVTAWEVSGPYTGSGLFDKAFPPETPGDTSAAWRLLPPSPYTAVNADWVWAMDLGTALGGDSRVAYLRTRIHSPAKQPVILEMGSDDGIKVWLNGKVVHRVDAPRSLKPDEDKAKVTLEEGWNTLLLKVVQGGGDWGAALAILGPDGKPMGGLRADPYGK